MFRDLVIKAQQIKPYIKGHITDGSLTFTFKINGNDITVPVGSDGKWKWVVDRTITSLYRMLCPTITTYADNIDNLVINANLESCTNFGVAIALTPLTKVVVKNQTAGLTDISYLAQDCKDLKEFIAPSLILGSRCNIGNMFLRCSNLEVVDLRSAQINTGGGVNMFSGCGKLKTINIEIIKTNLSLAWSPLLTAQSIINLFNAVAADITLTFHQNVWNMIMREIDVQGSPIQVAYQNMIDNYDVTIANASFDAEIEYLEGTGTQWIDTNIKFKPTTVFETRFMEINIPENPTPSNRTHIIGTHQGNTRYRLRRIEPDTLYFLYGSNGESWGAKTYIKNNIIDIYFSTTVLKYKIGNNDWVEEDISNTEQFVESPDTITLFHAKNINNIDTKFEGRFYYLKIWDNGNLVADFIPVRKGTTGYMYDKVSGNLFGNSGTGDFVLGNDK